MIYRYDFDGPLTLQREEIDAGVWITPEELDRRIESGDAELTENLVLIWIRYREPHHKTR